MPPGAPGLVSSLVSAIAGDFKLSDAPGQTGLQIRASLPLLAALLSRVASARFRG